MDILRHKYWDSGERKLQTYPVTNYTRLWKVWRALLQSSQHSNMYRYIETKASICFLYVAKGIAAEASVTERSDAFEADLSPHTQHNQMDEADQTQWHHWKQHPGWCWQENLQRKLWRNLFLPHCRWNHDQTWAVVTYITHGHVEYSNQLLPTASQHCCSDRPVFQASINCNNSPMALGLPKLCISQVYCWHWLLRAHKNPLRRGPTPHTPLLSCQTSHWAQCAAHGSRERLESRRVWMVLPTPLPARGWVTYGQWGAKFLKIQPQTMEPVQCHSHATPLCFVNQLIRNGLPT